jgi:polyhydroxyalkanoate synthesis regulator phasin
MAEMNEILEQIEFLESIEQMITDSRCSVSQYNPVPLIRVRIKRLKKQITEFENRQEQKGAKPDDTDERP